MSHVRTTALICACALVANVAADPAPAPPRRSENKEMLQDKVIVVRRMPIAYFYPFSLWPMPRYPASGKASARYHSLFHLHAALNSAVTLSALSESGEAGLPDSNETLSSRLSRKLAPKKNNSTCSHKAKKEITTLSTV